MVDFHSHILPAVDDGSKNINESLGLLKMLGEQNISTVIATPHFYADRHTIEDFLIRREKSYDVWEMPLKEKIFRL